MKKSLSTAGLGKIDSLDQLVILAHLNGFDAIDLPTNLVHEKIARDSLNSVSELFSSYGIEPGNVGFAASWGENISDKEFEKSLEECKKELPIMKKIGAQTTNTYLMPGCNSEVSAWYDLAARRIAKMNAVANDCGLRFGVEYVAPKHLIRMFEHPFVHNCAEMLDLLVQSGCNAGIVLDSIHWFSAEDTVQDLLQLDPNQIIHVHLNDSAYQEPVDNDRLYPGEGIIPLHDFLCALNKIGYSRYVALEVLSPTPMKESAEVLAKRAADGFNKVWPM